LPKETNLRSRASHWWTFRVKMRGFEYLLKQRVLQGRKRKNISKDYKKNKVGEENGRGRGD
jgi:hypothetical protein